MQFASNSFASHVMAVAANSVGDVRNLIAIGRHKHQIEIWQPRAGKWRRVPASHRDQQSRRLLPWKPTDTERPPTWTRVHNIRLDVQYVWHRMEFGQGKR